ncbi:class II glutamine amidotransferase [Kutzneria sp. CA-103260]|uniref:class II glutamine amidotransferase n=1 Tax=Kutzneria sp. CA-103260 TaxID=2802641 RepID=UPI001BA7DEFA|nr:class II glutamine amidotransferase [Kutzneria sp. CA-103260]QUQ65608.1 class II glutamine amidotransferase [Kutzneria sp. CA-103260]
MCRLFGLTAAPDRVRATFWLLEAPDSLARQSRRNPDGTGLGTFSPDGTPRVEKQPLAAFEDQEFAQEARDRESSTFVAHVRHATTGELVPRNTHPFEQHGRLFAHNGVLAGLDQLEAELGDHRDLVAGDTDSERLFALITKRVDEAGGNVTAGITAAVRWIADTLPLYAINLVLTTPTDLWALRYPRTHSLFVLDRGAGGPHGGRHLEHASPTGRLRVRSGDLATRPAVIVASERMDEDAGWRPLASGELLHVDSELTVHREVIIDHTPAHPLELRHLDARARAAQEAT